MGGPHRPVLLLLLLLLLHSATTSGTGGRGRVESLSREKEMLVAVERRGLIGSSPPKCRSKCGRCSPCTAVHVPIQPGVSIPLEYYPEAWRCKCGNNLYMP